MWAVIYCRVSTKEQLDNLSLSTQEKACREYCRRNDWEVGKVFLEKGESAKTADRTELTNLLEFCRKNKGKVHTVVVYALNRFARLNYHHHALRALLAKTRVTLRSVTEPIDDSSTGKLMEGVLSSFAEFDNNVRAERTTEGMKAALADGQWPWQAPLGYLQPAMRHDPVAAPLVASAFASVAGGTRRDEVLRDVTRAGLRTRKGAKLSVQSFNNLLRNPLYTGKMVVEDWHVETQGIFKPIVAEDVFLRVQAMLGGRKLSARAYLRGNSEFPLRHFVRCGVCGKPLTGSSPKGRNGTRYPYYHCPSRDCGVNVRKEVLEGRFLDLMARLTPKQEYLVLFQRIVLDTWKQKQGEAGVTRATLERRIDDLKEKKNRLVDAFVYRAAINEETYREQMEELGERLTLTDIELQDAKTEELDVEALLQFAHAVLQDAERLWVESPLEHRQRLQEVMFPEGLSYTEDGEFGTAVTCFAFNVLPEDWREIEMVASPTGREVLCTVPLAGLARD